MKWTVCICAVLAACQAGSTEQKSAEQKSAERTSAGSGTTVIQLPKPPVTDAYRTDIATLCDVVKLSGAEDKPKDERWTSIAMWLGPHITTDAGHDFLVAIQPLQGEAKALALETEARRVGLPKCDLANEWRQ